MSEILEENIAEDTNEYVIIGEENYKTKSVETGIDSIKNCGRRFKALWLL